MHIWLDTGQSMLYLLVVFVVLNADNRVRVQPTTANLSKYAKLDAEIEKAAQAAEAVAVRQGDDKCCCAGCGRRLQIKQPGVLL